MKRQKVIFFVSETDSETHPIQLTSQWDDNPEGIVKRYPAGVGMHPAIAQGVIEALQAKHDFGIKSVKLVLTGNISTCSIDDPCITF